jgi:AraC-like DNA-binding protein
MPRPRPRPVSRRLVPAVALHYVERPAPAPLAAAIECIWSVSDRVTRIARPPDRLTPDGCPELIVHRADRYARVVDGRLVRQPAAFLAGTLSRPWIVQAPARVGTIGVRFRPGGLTALFGASLAGTADREVPLGELPAPLAVLVATIRRARGPASALRAAEAWLLTHVAAQPGGRVPACAEAVRAIQRRRGRVGVEALAAAVGLPRRRLERLFRRETALSPKQYIRIVRLIGLLGRLDAPDRDRLIDVALDAGYFDQAHMARDFKALTERRATGRRGDDGELAVHFTRPDRLLRLLTGE